MQRIFYRPLPGNLGGILRMRYPATVNTPALEGIVSAASTAWREKHANDTTAVTPPTGQSPGALPAGAILPSAVPAKP